MIHVAYGTSNLYSKFAATSMLSLFDNTNADVTVHILHDDTLTVGNREKFVYIAGRYNQQVKFYNIEKICATEIEELKKKLSAVTLERFSIASTFRLLLSKIISTAIDKIIYLDADTIVNLDIRELWRVELGDKPFAAALDCENDAQRSANLLCRQGIVKVTDYFNSGIMLINLVQMRNEVNTIWGGVEFITKNPNYFFLDQDILNYCFSTRYLELPDKFNCRVAFERRHGRAIGKNLYHYIASYESLGLDINDIYHRLYWEYFSKTPYFNSETLLKLFLGVRKMYVERQNLLIKISALMSGKTRTFFTDIKNIDFIKNVFAVQDSEEILTLTSNESVQNLINLMAAQRGKKVFFIFTLYQQSYTRLRDLLKSVGFIEGQDFFNAADFLSEIHGVPLNSWEMIKNL